jgi:hypothetical protein
MGDDRFSSTQLALIALGAVALLLVGNVLKQLLFKNPNEPPVVFHLVPFIGSTITYGIDPVKFFFNCKKKVRRLNYGRKHFTDVGNSTAMYLPLSYSARRRRSTSVPKATISFSTGS